MHVIDHTQFDKKKKKPRASAKRGLILCVLLIGLVLVGGYLLFGQDIRTKREDTSQSNLPDVPIETPNKPQKLKKFSGQEFKELYSSFAYPNTQPLTEKPEITGDKKADERIRMIAERRGYKLSSIPVASIVKTEEPDLTDDDLIQPNALIAWKEMKTAALKDGVRLQMTSAYRSVEVQRALFLRRMQNNGVYVDSVGAGFVDDLVEELLREAAPPGYSRHHTGFTIDLACDGVGLQAFTTTSCYSWLSKNNYENTKKYGWVPSYPDGASLQGPEPEPWEYIWVGIQSLYE